MALPSFKEKVRTTGLIDFSNPGAGLKKRLPLLMYYPLRFYVYQKLGLNSLLSF